MLEDILLRIGELTELDTKNLVERGLKCSEEVGELSQAILSATGACGCDYKGLTTDHILEECVDVVIVALSIFYQNGGYTPKFLEVYNEKMAKWEQKVKK